MSSDSSGQSFVQKNLAVLAIVGSIVGVILLYLVISFFISNSVTNAGNKKQQILVADMKFVDSKLSNCYKQTKQSVGAAQDNAAKVNKIITEAVAGRYNQKGPANGASTQIDTSLLLNAVHEAYPTTDNVSDIYKEVLIVINGCQTDFTGAQDKLTADVALFNSWRTGSFTVRHFGGNKYPTKDLAINTFNEAGQHVKLTGQAALDKMDTLILTEETSNARGTGTQENSDPFGGS